MKKRAKSKYRKKDTVDIDLSEQHFKHLRNAYLEGQLTVNSKRLAEKMIDFEKKLFDATSSTKEKNKSQD